MKISRRQMINRVALGSMLGTVACTQRECAEAFIVAAVWFGLITWQDGSEFLADIFEQSRPPTGPADTTARGNSVPSETGAISNSIAGKPPPSFGGFANDARRNATDPTARAFYLLDDLGDDQVDGRVLAYEVTHTTARKRGQVTIRPAVFDGPLLILRDVALSPDGSFLVVSQSGTPPQWIFIDAATLTITARLMAPAGVFPRRCVISPDGKLAYAIASGVQFDQTPQPLSVQILDTAAHTIVGTIPLPANTAIDDWTITPDQGLLFGVGGGSLHILDVATGTYSGSVGIVAPLGSTASVLGNAQRLVMHPRGDRLFAVVTRFPTGAPQQAVVAVIDVRSAQKIDEYPLSYPQGVIGARIAISPDGRTLVVGFQRGSLLQVLDSGTGLEFQSVPMRRSGNGFATFSIA